MDLIDREKALACFDGWYNPIRDEWHDVEEIPGYEKLEELPIVAEVEDCISRQDAIDALWKALFEYEDKTEKQFQESEDLDVADWIMHRNFVQNMNDIDRQTILALPSAQPERKKGKWIKISPANIYECSVCGQNVMTNDIETYKFCHGCGADMRGEENDSI